MLISWSCRNKLWILTRMRLDSIPCVCLFIPTPPFVFQIDLYLQAGSAMAGNKKRQAMPTRTWLGWKLPCAIGRPWGGLQAPGRSQAGYSHLAMWSLWRKEYNLRHELANVAKLLFQTPTDPCSKKKKSPLAFLNLQTQMTVRALFHCFKSRYNGCWLWLSDKETETKRDFCLMQKRDPVYLSRFTCSQDAPTNNV